MTEPADEATIKRLLTELQSWDQNRRREAVLEIIRLKIEDDRLEALLITLAVNDLDKIVRVAARKALGTEIPEKPEAKSKSELTRNEKIRDFLIGFVGWYVVNGVIWLVLTSGGSLNGTGPTAGYGFVFNLFILPANIIVLLVVTFVRRWMALGILTSYAVNFLLAIMLGLMFQAACWIPFFIK